MATVRKSGRGWLARYRPYRASAQVCVRVPASVWRCASDPAAACRAWAERIDALTDSLERWPSPAAVSEGVAVGVLTAEQASDLRGLIDPLGVDPAISERPKAPTVTDAWDEHPSTVHERRNALSSYKDAARDVARWVAWSGSDLLSEVTLERVQSYETHLVEIGLAFETRKKAVRVLRRAAAAGKSFGVVDQLAGAVIGRRTVAERRRPRPRGWSLDEIAAMLAACDLIDDPRVGAAIALMGCMGLRVSEVARALVEDFDGSSLRVGERHAKTTSSVRELPVPSALCQYLSRACSTARPGQALVGSLMGGRIGASMGHRTCGRWLADQVLGLCGRRQPAKVLRASFASWCMIAGVEAGCYEAYMGHDVADVAQITRDHYTTAAVRAWIARHGGQRMHDAIQAAIDRASTDDAAARSAAQRWESHREAVRAERALRKAAGASKRCQQAG